MEHKLDIRRVFACRDQALEWIDWLEQFATNVNEVDVDSGRSFAFDCYRESLTQDLDGVELLFQRFSDAGIGPSSAELEDLAATDAESAPQLVLRRQEIADHFGPDAVSGFCPCVIEDSGLDAIVSFLFRAKAPALLAESAMRNPTFNTECVELASVTGSKQPGHFLLFRHEGSVIACRSAYEASAWLVHQLGLFNHHVWAEPSTCRWWSHTPRELLDKSIRFVVEARDYVDTTINFALLRDLLKRETAVMAAYVAGRPSPPVTLNPNSEWLGDSIDGILIDRPLRVFDDDFWQPTLVDFKPFGIPQPKNRQPLGTGTSDPAPVGMVQTISGDLVRNDELTDEARPTGEWAILCGVAKGTIRNRMDQNEPGATWRVVESQPQRYRIHLDDLPKEARASKPIRDDRLRQLKE